VRDGPPPPPFGEVARLAASPGPKTRKGVNEAGCQVGYIATYVGICEQEEHSLMATFVL
jgi:hypothetical protein